MATACQEQEHVKPKQTPQADQQAIDNFIHFIDFTRKEMERHPTLNKDEITRIVTASIPSFEKQYGISLSPAVTSKQSLQGRAAYYGEPEGFDILQNMVYYAETATDENAYLNEINSLNNQILSLDISDESKTYLLTTIGMHAGLVDYLDDIEVLRRVPSSDFYAQTYATAGAPKCDGWWSCWGRCAFSVVGSAGMGAMSGAGIGGSGCTLVLPVVGTVTCGAAGAVVGAVFGGMAGSRACE